MSVFLTNIRLLLICTRLRLQPKLREPLRFSSDGVNLAEHFKHNNLNVEGWGHALAATEESLMKSLRLDARWNFGLHCARPSQHPLARPDR